MDQMPAFMHNTFWAENEIALVFASQPGANDEEVAQNTHLRDLATFLEEYGYTLSEAQDGGKAPSSRAQSVRPSFYTYSDPRVAAPDEEVVATTFLHFTVSPASVQASTDSTSDDTAPVSDPFGLYTTPVARLVRFLYAQLGPLQRGEASLRDGTRVPPVPLQAVSPNWNCGASGSSLPNGYVTTGCPLTPPMPAVAPERDGASPGRWPITLPALPTDLKKMTGDDVTVFVLDTFPRLQDIKRAAAAAGGNNLSLLDLLHNAQFSYPTLPAWLDRPNPRQVKTGRDIKGRVVGFRMPDHGLFVAGIVRELAPQAHVECIRVLNDFCAGTVQVLMDQFSQIQRRLDAGGDLEGRDVVINLSMVIPGKSDVEPSGIDLENAHLGLLLAMQALEARGAIFVASAGNEGDKRYMQPDKKHPDALYPAAFAYPTSEGGPYLRSMIPVGAVNGLQEVSSYSCYPGLRGVATYGGETPCDSSILEDRATRMTVVDSRQVDAMIGVYTQLSYPALSFNDPEASYIVPNPHGWAYWSGTSFATPIVSAVVARSLELDRRNGATPGEQDVENLVLYAAAKGEVAWDLGDASESRSVNGALIIATQDQPGERTYERPTESMLSGMSMEV